MENPRIAKGPGARGDPADFPFEPRYADIDGHRVHYVEAGSGATAILLLHGIPENSYVWRKVIPALSAGARAIAPDFLGFGGSDKPLDADYGLSAQSDRLAKFVEALGLGRVVIVGMDMGLMVGLDYAMKRPEKIAGIVMFEGLFVPVEVSERLASLPARLIRAAMLRTYETMFSKDLSALRAMLRGGTLRKLSEEELGRYLEPFADAGPRKAVLVGGIGAKRLYAPLSDPASLRPGIGAYARALAVSEIPKLLLYGKPGLAVDARLIAYARKAIPNLAVECVGPGRHYLPEDCPAEIGRAVAAFVAALGTVQPRIAPATADMAATRGR